MAINDLTEQDPIVDPETGKPTPYFMRLIMDRGSSQLTTEEQVALLNALEIIAGAGLDGGGVLGAGANITIDANASAILDLITTTRGSILYRGASAWAGLAPGTSGYFLKSNGAGADPSYAAASGGGAWSLLDASGAVITSGTTWTWSTNVANVDVTNLGGYTDLMVVARGLTTNISGNRNIQVSVNNGTSFYSASGDYIAVSEAGVEANAAAMLIHDTASASARSLTGVIYGSGVTGGQKLGVGPGTGNNRQRLFVASTSPINALRLVPGGGGNLTAGSLYVYAR